MALSIGLKALSDWYQPLSMRFSTLTTLATALVTLTLAFSPIPTEAAILVERVSLALTALTKLFLTIKTQCIKEREDGSLSSWGKRIIGAGCGQRWGPH